MSAFTPVILFIDLNNSYCGACGKETLPDGETHARTSGYGTNGPGCGARWTHVSSHYSGLNMASRVGGMRPDLTWLPFDEATQHDATYGRSGAATQ